MPPCGHCGPGAERRRGAARSGVQDALPAHARDLIALIEKLRLGKVHLVGNSAGAFICLLDAQQRPDLVRTFTLEEPPVVSIFLQAMPSKPGEVFKLLLSSPPTLAAFIRFGAGVISPVMKAFQKGQNDAGLATFARRPRGRPVHEGFCCVKAADEGRPHAASPGAARLRPAGV